MRRIWNSTGLKEERVSCFGTKEANPLFSDEKGKKAVSFCNLKQLFDEGRAYWDENMKISPKKDRYHKIKSCENMNIKKDKLGKGSKRQEGSSQTII